MEADRLGGRSGQCDGGHDQGDASRAAHGWSVTRLSCCLSPYSGAAARLRQSCCGRSPMLWGGRSRRMWWNKPIGGSDGMLLGGLRATRREFVCGMLGAASLCGQDGKANRLGANQAEVQLSIERAKIEVAPGHTITTSTYNGTAPGPLIRLKEGVPASIH